MLDRRAALAAIAFAPPVFAQSATDAAKAADVPEAIEVEAGVYMMQGAPGEPGPANRARVGNAGFIVGRNGVIAIDTGVSRRHGEALLQSIASVTDRPVRLAVLTHARQEFLFGATAYQARGIPVTMQRDAAKLMASRCENCLKTLKRELGDDEMRDTALPKPDELFDDDNAMDMIGRTVLLLTYGHSSGPGDSIVFDARSGTVFGGGLVDHRRIPDVQDADFEGWRHALAGLRTLRVNTVVPGHGAATSSDVIDATERYLLRLETRVAALVKAGTALSEVPDAAALPEYATWDQYDTVHRRNAAIVYLRLERQAMFRPDGAAR